jgi:hypothetical protein
MTDHERAEEVMNAGIYTRLEAQRWAALAELYQQWLEFPDSTDLILVAARRICITDTEYNLFKFLLSTKRQGGEL